MTDATEFDGRRDRTSNRQAAQSATGFGPHQRDEAARRGEDDDRETPAADGTEMFAAHMFSRCGHQRGLSDQLCRRLRRLRSTRKHDVRRRRKGDDERSPAEAAVH
jgi:hypothetical protein